MSGKHDKKLRRIVNKKIRYDLQAVLKIIESGNLLERFALAVRIIFKWRLGERLKLGLMK